MILNDLSLQILINNNTFIIFNHKEMLSNINLITDAYLRETNLDEAEAPIPGRP